MLHKLHNVSNGVDKCPSSCSRQAISEKTNLPNSLHLLLGGLGLTKTPGLDPVRNKCIQQAIKEDSNTTCFGCKKNSLHLHLL